MNQFDNYELTTLDYALKYYLEHNEMLEDDDIEWCNLVRKKIDQNVAINLCHSHHCKLVQYQL